MSRWLHSALAGAGILSIKALLIAGFVLAEAARAGDMTVAGRMLFILLTLGVSGAVGGLAYAAAESRGVRYYTRWVVAAEAALAAYAAQVALVRVVETKPQPHPMDVVVDFLFTEPLGPLLMAVAAGVTGLIYGRVLRD